MSTVYNTRHHFSQVFLLIYYYPSALWPSLRKRRVVLDPIQIQLNPLLLLPHPHQIHPQDVLGIADHIMCCIGASDYNRTSSNTEAYAVA